MVRSDVMDSIDISLRKHRSNPNTPFGGVQMVFFGDLFQLPPVLNDDDGVILHTQYKNTYFFNAKVFDNFTLEIMELNTIFRQDEKEIHFISLLNNIRINTPSPEDMALLNSRVQPVDNDDDFIYLSARRAKSDSLNKDKLKKLPGELKTYQGISLKEYLDADNANQQIELVYPAPLSLELKKGAKIMMLNNDQGQRWVNGTIGTVQELKEETVIINIAGSLFPVFPHTWVKYEYVLTPLSKHIEEKQAGSFTQFPIQLAYSITIHKSQGMTFEKGIIDIGSGAFDSGQVYVALSRCKTFGNLFLVNPINDSDIRVDIFIVEYYNTLFGKHDIQLDNKKELQESFEKELIDYLNEQIKSGYSGAYKAKEIINSKRDKLTGALFLAGLDDKKGTLRILQSRGMAGYSIEALCLKDKYISIVGKTIRLKAAAKLRTVGFDIKTINEGWQ
jgi:hypothetical protein